MKVVVLYTFAIVSFMHLTAQADANSRDFKTSFMSEIDLYLAGESPYPSGETFENGPPNYSVEGNGEFISKLLSKADLTRILSRLHRRIKTVLDPRVVIASEYQSTQGIQKVLNVLLFSAKYRGDLWTPEKISDVIEIYQTLLLVKASQRNMLGGYGYTQIMNSVEAFLGNVRSGLNTANQKKLVDLAYSLEGRVDVYVAHRVLQILLAQFQLSGKRVSKVQLKRLMAMYQIGPVPEDGRLSLRSSPFHRGAINTTDTHYPIADYDSANVLHFQEMSLIQKGLLALQSLEIKSCAAVFKAKH